MRKIKVKERIRAGNIYCPYCKPEKVNAIWRLSGFMRFNKDCACNEHKDILKKREYFQELIDDQPLTEADYQTWNRT